MTEHAEGFVVKPGTAPGHVIAARTAHAFLDDIEDMLAEEGLSVDLAPTVADLADVSGLSIEGAIRTLNPVLRETRP